MSEVTLRLGAFAAVLLLMTAWEALLPRRSPVASRPARWIDNLGMVALGALLARVLLPWQVAEIATLSAERGWGLLHRLAVPPAIALLASIILLDLVVYAQHVAFHALPLLFRLHRVHHADVDFDATTGVRFHPIEILLSALLKMGVVLAVGAPWTAVVAFEVLLNATSVFNHGNVRLPAALDRSLRLIVVTPDMHRVHHSAVTEELNRNFGFNLPWWDRLFGTYLDQPSAGHASMVIGLPSQERRRVPLPTLLVMPFRSVPTAASTTRSSSGGSVRNR